MAVTDGVWHLPHAACLLIPSSLCSALICSTIRRCSGSTFRFIWCYLLALCQISDTLKFPYMMHCCSDNKQVISWVRGQLPAGFDSLFLNLAQEAPYDSRFQSNPKAGDRWVLYAPRCCITASAIQRKHRLPHSPYPSFLRQGHRTKALAECIHRAVRNRDQG